MFLFRAMADFVLLISKPLEIRFVLLLPVTNLQNRTGSDLFSPDKIRHVQFRHVDMSACRHMLACRHVGQDQTRSGFPKFVTENGHLRVDFPQAGASTVIVRI